MLGRVPEGEHVEGGGGSAVQHLAQRPGFLPGRGHLNISFNNCFLQLRWSKQHSSSLTQDTETNSWFQDNPDKRFPTDLTPQSR